MGEPYQAVSFQAASNGTSGVDPITSDARFTSSDVSGCIDPLGGAAARQRQSLCELVVRFRARYGLGPVKLDLTLDLAAQFHAEDMSARNYFDHVSPEGTRVSGRVANYSSAGSFSNLSENIAVGSSSAETIMNLWINSPSHRANLLDPAFHRMGVGAANLYWVQVFSN